MSINTRISDESIDTDQLDERDVRALTECMTVLDADAPGFYTVTTESGREYTVDARGGSCSCPDAEYRDPEGGCKHVRRAGHRASAVSSRFGSGLSTLLTSRRCPFDGFELHPTAVVTRWVVLEMLFTTVGTDPLQVDRRLDAVWVGFETGKHLASTLRTGRVVLGVASATTGTDPLRHSYVSGE